MFEHILGLYRLAGSRHHDETNALSETWVGHRYCRSALHRVMPCRQRLNFCWIDIVAAAYNNILLAAGNAQIALLIDPAEIAGHEPAVAVERFFGRLLIIEITEH